ncbi:MAG TPA: KpsF/GutQ family sugar-phosphate isomerase, partial [Candidatus Lambdaproteobacteria bacterium]|nr:KpsF/GutQ family sugar-phosphate isomerase [Candidatus Lambdaproteobacteria bacterium]
MTKMSPLLERALETLQIEIAGLEGLIKRLDSEFEEAVNLLFACGGKVILAGMGKSGLIAQKIAATLTSTGTPALFLHAGESTHGDLGIITKQDVVIAFSYSGETNEVLQMIGHIQAIGVPLIAMTGKPDSTLAQAATVHLSIAVEKEACPLGLTPTASSTATLALGDALAMCLLEQRQFSEDDFALFHPGGSLGRKLTIKI